MMVPMKPDQLYRPESDSPEFIESEGYSPEKKLTIPERVVHGFEVLFVALGGNLALVAIFFIFQVDPSMAMQNSLSVFLLLIGEAVITLTLIFTIFWYSGEPSRIFSTISRNWKTEVQAGFAAVPLLFLCTFSVGLIFQFFFPELVTQENPLLNLIKTPFDVTLFLMSSLFVGGLKEEVQRAFILLRFESSLGGVWLGLILWSSFFGFGHSVQGIDNAFAAGALGLVFGLIYIWRRNLIAVIVAHAFFDVCTVFIYWIFISNP